MNLYLRKDGRYESRVPNGKKSDGKRAFLYVLARTKEQCIERVQAICQQNKPQGYCTLTIQIAAAVRICPSYCTGA